MFILLLFVLLLYVNSYSINGVNSIRNSRISLNAKKEGGGGFGKPKVDNNVIETTATSSSSSSSIKIMDFQGVDKDESSSSLSSSTTTSSLNKSDIAKNLKQESSDDIENKILNTKMFQDQRSKSKIELEEKIRRLKEEEDLIASDPSVGAVPEIIANRMITRIAGFFGIPVFGGLAIFVGAFFYSKSSDSIVPPYIIAYATQVPFVLGLIGISYAILSSSWDEDRDGSLLGFDELQLNLKRVQEGFGRVQDTARLKDEIEKDTNRLGGKK